MAMACPERLGAGTRSPTNLLVVFALGRLLVVLGVSRLVWVLGRVGETASRFAIWILCKLSHKKVSTGMHAWTCTCITIKRQCKDIVWCASSVSSKPASRYTLKYAGMDTSTHATMYACTHPQFDVWISACVDVCVSVWTCMYARTCMHISIGAQRYV